MVQAIKNNWIGIAVSVIIAVLSLAVLPWGIYVTSETVDYRTHKAVSAQRFETINKWTQEADSQLKEINNKQTEILLEIRSK